MSAACELCAQIGGDNLAHQALTYNPLTEAENINIVMLPGASSAECIMAHGSSGSGNFVGYNTHADAAGAN
jgi:hypothetical protein